MKKFSIVMCLALVLSLGTSVMAQDAPPGCPEGLWTLWSAELESACKGELAGTVVTMAGPFVDADEAKFNAAIAEFEGWTGIDIQYTGSKEFEAAIRASVDADAAPDIVDFPQPGLLKDFVQQGKVVDASTFLNADWLAKNYKESWLDMAKMPGPDGDITAGVWNRNNGKDLVWYPKAAWDAAGYAIPTTWDELIALSDQIVADGASPWCVGMESGAATGWAATDWIETIMLRTTSLENYDNWSFPADPANRLPFTSPEVKNAAEVLASIWFKEGYVYGGREAIAGTSFGDAPGPMFDNPPKCYMHKQGNFITSFFPETVTPADYDFFYLPPIDPEYGKPFEVAGDIYAMFNDRPETRAVLDFFSRGESVKAWLQAGGTLAPHNDVQPEWYTNEIERKIATLIAEASSVRFDGSDLQPGAVGSGSFWKGMTDWVSGTADLDTVLAEIDAAWPK
ncbi:MAG: ABC transporter substrate-binding protein [Chloroflexi bacterium]|nr:ABC transporter substrate-binding protein [Chloroflexota bacterium]MCC6894523.1 carbohydrate ABC transporter substrate-binding protein [Anaerolineae bacterium]